MKLTVDTNILFSFFWKSSVTKEIIENSELEFVAPEYAIEELGKYKQEIMKKTRISAGEFNNELQRMRNFVMFEKREKYMPMMKNALAISPDSKDAEFLALCMTHKCPLWSNDTELKSQDAVQVIDTEELIRTIF